MVVAFLLLLLLIGKDLSVLSRVSCLKVIYQLSGSFEIDRKCVEGRIEILSWHGIDIASDRFFNRFPDPEFTVQALGCSIGISKRTKEIQGLFSRDLTEVFSEEFI